MNKKPLTRTQKWYRKKKKELGKKFLKERAAIQKKRADEIGDAYREYQRQYHKRYYQENKTTLKNKLKKYRRKKPDKKVNERIAKCIAWQKEALTDNYVKRILRNSKASYKEIEIKRNEILIDRISKQIKIKENEQLQNSRPS